MSLTLFRPQINTDTKYDHFGTLKHVARRPRDAQGAGFQVLDYLGWHQNKYTKI